MGAAVSGAEVFHPEKHFRNLKGQQYLEVKWRAVWFRQEHPTGFVASWLVEHDQTAGYAVFKAIAGYWLDGVAPPPGWEEAIKAGMPVPGLVYGAGHGDEARKDFADYLTKAETKAEGRAFAMLGYGTANALELEEDDNSIADSPVERQGKQQRSPRAPAAAPRGLAMVREPVDLEALRAEVERALAADADAAGKLPKAPAEMSEPELTKTLAWLNRRARALSS